MVYLAPFFLLCIEKMKKKAIIDLWQRRRKDINLQKQRKIDLEIVVLFLATVGAITILWESDTR